MLSPYKDVPSSQSSSLFDLEGLAERKASLFSRDEIKRFIGELDSIDSEAKAKQLVESYEAKLKTYYRDLKDTKKYLNSGKLDSILEGRSSSVDAASAPPPLSYKARPLDGIWSTAPYLHNGSVPNLYELLSPVSERSTEFHVGSTKFDPEKVGFVTESSTGTTKFDTTQPGNSNAGHDMYGDFTEEERWQLVEYMKTL